LKVSTALVNGGDWLASVVIFTCHMPNQATSKWVTQILVFTFGTVNLAILIVKTASAYWLTALAADETSHMKRVLECIHHLLIVVSAITDLTVHKLKATETASSEATAEIANT